MTDTAIEDEAPAPAPAPAPARRFPVALVAGLVVAVLLALGLWLAYRPAPDQIQGMVDAREMRITSKVTGRIGAFHVEEGQPVKAGQLLYTLDSPEVAAKSEQAGGVLAAAISATKHWPCRRQGIKSRCWCRKSTPHAISAAVG